MVGNKILIFNTICSGQVNLVVFLDVFCTDSLQMY